MRVLIDTNVLINNLLSPAATTTATGIVLQAAVEGRFTLLLAASVLIEFDRKLTDDARLRRISRADAGALIELLSSVAEIVPLLPEPYPAIGRDRDDDFLIAHCVVAEADYLVTWDKDLRDLQHVDRTRIVSPPEFIQVLREAGAL